MKKLPHTHSCFVCGDANAAGLKLRFETDGRRVYTHFTPRPEHIGFRNVVHGGILSALLDEIMVWACMVVTKRAAYCAELNVRFLKPVRPGDHLVTTAELITNRRDRIYETAGDLKNEAGDVVATATGKYMPAKKEETANLLADVIGDTDFLR